MANAFTIQGATPTLPKPQMVSSVASGTPYENALNKLSGNTSPPPMSSFFAPTSASYNKAGQPLPSSSQQTPQTGSYPGILGTKPSTPLKSLTDVAGNTATFHAPDTATAGDSSNTSDTGHTTTLPGGNQSSPDPFPGTVGLLAQKSAEGSPQQQQVTKQLADTSVAGSPAATRYAEQTSQYGAGNIPLGQKAQDISKDYSDQIRQLVQNLGAGQAGYSTSGMMRGIAQGQSLALQNALGSEITGLSNAENSALTGNAQALTGQGQAATAANEAGGLANTQQANVQSGLTSAGGLANTAQQNVQSGLNQAGTLQYPVTLSANSGQYQASPTTGQGIGAGLAGGVAAYQNFQNVLSNSSIATSNAPLASNISQNMQQLSNAGTQVMQVMNQVGPNIPGGAWATTPIANSLQSAYLTNQNPTAKTTITSGLNEMQGYISSLLGSLPGQTPTALTDAVQNADFSKLSPNQLNDFLTNMQNYAASRLQPIQQTATAAQNANLGGSTPAIPLYMGNTANPGMMQAGTPNSTGTAIVGSGLSATAGLVQNLLSGLGSAAHDTTAGLGLGAGEKLFGTAAAF